MAETVFEDWMSDSDALTWGVERDPLLRSTIAGVWILDREPDRERFEAKIERATRKIPRLRQRVVEDPFGIAPPRWEFDPYFDLSYHLRRLRVAGQGSLRDVLDLIQPIAVQAFDKDRPLWELYLVTGLEGGRCAFLMKLHHAVSDGVGMVDMTSSMVETFREPDPARKPRTIAVPEGPVLTPAEHTREALRHRARQLGEVVSNVARGLLDEAGTTLRDPLGAARRVADTAGSVGRLLEPVSEPLSPVMRERSLGVHFDQIEVPLAEMKRAGKSVGGTVNDAFVAVVAGGLRRYHEHLGHEVASLRMTMPINMRGGEKAHHAGNQFVPARLLVPMDIKDPGERMRAIGARVREQRNEPANRLFGPVSALLNQLPGSASAAVAGGMLKAIDFVTSNVPGPQFEVYLSGAKIEQIFGFGPLAGAAINVTTFSYDGTMGIGIASDPAAVSDPAMLRECMVKSADEVLAVL